MDDDEPPLTNEELRWLRSDKRHAELQSAHTVAVFCILALAAVLLAIAVGAY
jgi:hypothetical protein